MILTVPFFKFQIRRSDLKRTALILHGRQFQLNRHIYIVNVSDIRTMVG